MIDGSMFNGFLVASKTMTLNKTTIQHQCSLIRTYIEGEYKDLTCSYILYDKPENKSSTIKDMIDKNDLSKLPPALLDRDVEHCMIMGSCFLGLHAPPKRGIFKMFKKKKYTAYFFINTQGYTDKITLQFNLYHLLWHALRCYVLNHQGAKKQTVTPDKSEALRDARDNLIADVFCAIILRQINAISSANKLARFRCKSLFKQNSGFYPEQFPYPIACEATIMLLEDLKYTQNNQEKHTTQGAMDLANEVIHTFNDEHIEQWVKFAQTLQYMVWQGMDKNRILQAAIYTCENPFTRSMAYLVSEYLNIDPRPVSDNPYYNPFTSDDVNERLHYRLCRNQLNDILNDVEIHNDDDAFLNCIDMLINHQEQQFEKGNLLGWCVPALKAVKTKYFTLKTDVAIQAHERFSHLVAHHELIFTQSKWADLKMIGDKIITLKRQKNVLSQEDIQSFLEEIDRFGDID